MKRYLFVIKNSSTINGKIPLYDPEMGFLLAFADEDTAKERLEYLKGYDSFENAKVIKSEVLVD